VNHLRTMAVIAQTIGYGRSVHSFGIAEAILPQPHFELAQADLGREARNPNPRPQRRHRNDNREAYPGNYAELVQSRWRAVQALRF